MAQKQLSVLGNLRIAGALVLDENNNDFPINPKPGTMLIKDLTLYAFITIAGQQAWYPIIQRPTGTANYLHTQAVPALEWTVTHNLNTTEYWWQIQDTSGNLLDPLSIVPVDNNSFKVEWAEAQDGSMILVGTSDIYIDTLEIGNGTTT